MINRIEDYEKKGFEGVDVNLETALFEYNLIWAKNENCSEDEFYFVYGVGGDAKNDYGMFVYTEFDSAYLTKKDFSEGFYFEGDNLKSIEKFTDSTKEELINNFPHSVYDVIGYHGTENVLGSNCYGGFKIYNDESLEYLMKDKLPHGSGIDCTWEIELKKEFIICKNSWHLMNENGYYDGYIDFTIKVNPDKPEDFKLTFQTNSRGYYQIQKHDLRTYLEEIFYTTLTEEISF